MTLAGDTACPHCRRDVARDLRDIFRKTDAARFDCPHCERPIAGAVTHTVRLTKDDTP